MRSRMSALGVILLFASLVTAADKQLVERAKAATVLLYSQDESGSMRMRCTATAFEKTQAGYRFVSAAHCIGNDDTQKEKVADASNIPFYVTFDATEVKTFYAAAVTGVGYQHRGDDFATFDVATTGDWPTIPLGDEKKADEGDEILNVASPLGLGKQVFHGSIAKLELDRPIVEGDINWKGSMTLQLPGTDGGSSGSAIISADQKAIVAFLVGTIGGSTIIAIPISKFHKFREQAAAGKYKYARDKDD
mgnify:CR=1 FL=1